LESNEEDDDDELLPSAEDMGLTVRARGAVLKFVQIMNTIREHAKTISPGELLEEVIKATDYSTLVQDADDGAERWVFVQELINLAKEPPQDVDETMQDRLGLEALGAFLEGISLLTNAESREEEGGDTTKLMTLHASKGLEFNSVFIGGIEDGLIPFVRNGDNEDDQDEEVRLFYVGITRAKRKLFLCHARERRRFGQGPQAAKRSFLLDSISAVLAGTKAPERSVSLPPPSSKRGGGSAYASARGGASKGKKVDWGARVTVDSSARQPATRITSQRQGSRGERIAKTRELVKKVAGESTIPLPLRKAQAAKDAAAKAADDSSPGGRRVRRRNPEQ